MKVTSGRNLDKNLGINILNHVPRVDGKRSTWEALSIAYVKCYVLMIV